MTIEFSYSGVDREDLTEAPEGVVDTLRTNVGRLMYAIYHEVPIQIAYPAPVGNVSVNPIVAREVWHARSRPAVSVDPLTLPTAPPADSPGIRLYSWSAMEFLLEQIASNVVTGTDNVLVEFVSATELTIKFRASTTVLHTVTAKYDDTNQYWWLEDLE